MTKDLQQLEAVPFTESLEATDKSAGVPDGQYPLQLVDVVKYVGKKYQSEEPQDKLRFVFVVLSGPEKGSEVWNIENLPNIKNGRRTIGPKSGVRSFLGLLRGRPLVDTENVSPADLVNTTGYAQIAEGKFQSFVPMDLTQSVPERVQPSAKTATPEIDAQTETF